MSAQRTRDRIYKRSVGLLVIFSILALLFFMRLYQQTAGPFRASIDLIATLPRADGVSVDTPITLAGLKVGRVTGVNLSDNNLVRLDLQIEARVRHKLRADSQATLHRPLLGAAFIDLGIGSPEQPELADGDSIAMRRAPDVNDLLATLPARLEQVDSILANVNGLSEDLRRSANQLTGQDSALQQSLAQVARVAAQAEGSVARMDRTLDALQGVVADTGQAVARANSMLGELQPLTARAGEIGDSLGRTLANVEAASADLRRATPQLPEVIAAGQNALDEADAVLRAAQNSFLLRGNLPPPAPVPSVPSPRP